jgi:hypothetical protein
MGHSYVAAAFYFGTERSRRWFAHRVPHRTVECFQQVGEGRAISPKLVAPWLLTRAPVKFVLLAR